MKKILLLTIDFPPQIGGVANYLANLSQNLAFDKIIILTIKQNNSAIFDQKQNYKIYRENLISNLPIWPKWLPAIYHTFKALKKEKPNLILAGQILPLGTVALICKKIIGLDYFVSCHGMDILTAQKTPRKKKLAKLILKNAKHIIANSQFTKNEIIKLGAEDSKITVIYPCPHTKSVIARSSAQSGRRSNLFSNLDTGLPLSPPVGGSELAMTKQDKKVILTVGRLVARKGQDQVIKALPKVSKKFPDLIYFIVGSGPYEDDLKKLAKNLDLEKNIIFTGKVSDGELADYYQKADIFIMPSRQIKSDVEGFGIVYLEAASYGLPVIAGKSGGISEAVIDGETGLLVDPENIAEISTTIIKLLENKNLAQSLGQAGKVRVEKEFNWPVQVEKLIDFLK